MTAKGEQAFPPAHVAVEKMGRHNLIKLRRTHRPDSIDQK